MSGTVSGPMFEPVSDDYRKSSFGKQGGYYNIFATHTPDTAMALLRAYFPDGEANEMNFVLFSTSGIHGSYSTIEEEWAAIGKSDEYSDDHRVVTEGEVTFVLVQPRIVGMTYGNARIRTAEDVTFLKKLRASSWKAVQKIGAAERHR